jgi:iron complex outermembrane receptor protein
MNLGSPPSTLLLLLSSFFTLAQTQTASPTFTLQEVVVSSTRIDIPLSENSRTIQYITASELKVSGAFSVAEALQQLAGIDVRRRGTAGMQADLYIRGGGFDQTLLLIDGIKLDDAQTGHHSLNFLPPLEVIERIEVVKGPAARVFGQNAFTGAVNIVTKSEYHSLVKVQLRGGSYNQWQGGVTLQENEENKSFFLSTDLSGSEGYRYNTDFRNQNFFLKADFFKKSVVPVQMIGSFSDRKFGANGFYASPDAKDQYEETQGSVVAFQSKIAKNQWVFKPRIYWRRGQDHYLFLRQQPQVYENWHITHKVGVAFDTSLSTSLGVTGIGFDLARVSISSNNLGQHSRRVSSLFLEQRFSFWNQKIDFTPGIALSNYSDFGTFAYPGFDFGWKLTPKWRLYGSLGYTYRIPTYTDLYYEDRTTRGNSDLKPEEALTQEAGFRYTQKHTQFYVTIFNRSAKDLIDYTKTQEDALWEATNIQELNTLGWETEWSQRFFLGTLPQRVQVGYTYLRDDLKQLVIDFSRYSVNSLKHHLTFRYTGKWSRYLQGFLGVKYGQRPLQKGYTVVDFNLQINLKKFQIEATLNNLLNTRYSETNLVPMPGRNGLLGLKYSL